MTNKISVIITNWNGLKLLQKNLPSVLDNSPEASEFILADDFSQDESLKYVAELQKKHPRLKILRQQRNFGFIGNSNRAVLASTGNLVVLLNNDIRVFPGYIKHALKHFANPKTFGVGFAEVNNPNWPRLYWQSGYLQHLPMTTTKAHISGWLSGGSSIIRKDIFVKLGGFDPIYAPFYCEDLDLGFRAWKSGFRLIWEPSAKVDHHHESTISQFPRHDLDRIKERNRLLVVWRNITNPRLLRLNRLGLISRVIFGPNYIKIIIFAKKRISQFPPPKFIPVLTDIDVLKLFSR